MEDTIDRRPAHTEPIAIFPAVSIAVMEEIRIVSVTEEILTFEEPATELIEFLAADTSQDCPETTPVVEELSIVTETTPATSALEPSEDPVTVVDTIVVTIVAVTSATVELETTAAPELMEDTLHPGTRELLANRRVFVPVEFSPDVKVR
jgi:hypothetical protein